MPGEPCLLAEILRFCELVTVAGKKVDMTPSQRRLLEVIVRDAVAQEREACAEIADAAGARRRAEG